MSEQNQNQKPNQKSRKRRILPTLLLISLVCNLLLGAVLNYKLDDKSGYEAIFRSEITFAIQRFEECEKQPDESNYMVGVSHLYAAYVMTEEFEEDNMVYQYSGEFYDLWNLAAAYPDEFQKHLDKLVPILKDIKKDRNFKNTDAMIALQELNNLLRATVV